MPLRPEVVAQIDSLLGERYIIAVPTAPGLCEARVTKEPEKNTDQHTKRFDVSVQTRDFEIDLFWKRSLFFWGFISAAFIAYASLCHTELRIAVACFGMVCSCAWTLVNRGSKYWQENWETKVEHSEMPVTGVLFAKEEKRQSQKGWWLSGRQYSVSKLAIALSDYVSVLWISIVVGEAILPFVPLNARDAAKRYSMRLFIGFSAVYVVLLLVYGRKTPHPTTGKG